MPPRKRKAQQPKLLAICEEEPVEEAQEQATCNFDDIIEEATRKVEALVQDVIEDARHRAHSLRNSAETELVKYTPTLKKMTVAEFFQLSPEEAKGDTVYDVAGKLAQLVQQNPDQATAAEPIAEMFALATNVTRRTTSRTQAAAAPSTTAAAARSTRHTATDASGPSTSFQATVVKSGTSRLPLGPSNQNAAGHTRVLRQGETTVYSANGSPIQVVLQLAEEDAAPSTVIGAGKRAVATPAFVPAASMTAGKGQHAAMALTGHTFRRTTATRGRTAQLTKSFAVITKDGNQFVVDDYVGMKNIPAKYHAEVAALIKQDVKDLTDVASVVVRSCK